jgi:hypothetical protein
VRVTRHPGQERVLCRPERALTLALSRRARELCGSHGIRETVSGRANFSTGRNPLPATCGRRYALLRMAGITADSGCVSRGPGVARPNHNYDGAPMSLALETIKGNITCLDVVESNLCLRVRGFRLQHSRLW